MARQIATKVITPSPNQRVARLCPPREPIRSPGSALMIISLNQIFKKIKVLPLERRQQSGRRRESSSAQRRTERDEHSVAALHRRQGARREGFAHNAAPRIPVAQRRHQAGVQGRSRKDARQEGLQFFNTYLKI